MDPKQVVADGYDHLHDLYARSGALSRDDVRHRYIDAVLDLAELTPRSALDLGCGTGRHATAYLVAKGLQVTGVDLSPKSIEVAAREVPDARFLVGDMASVELPAESFDIVTAFYSLIHVPMAEHRLVLQQVWSWLRPGGYLVATMGGGHSPAETVDPAWLGTAPMYWSNWDGDANRELIRDGGFEEVEATVTTTVENGQEVAFLWVIARR